MADSIKKTTEENELLNEAQDMELGDETGASLGLAITGLTITVAGAGLTGSAIASQKYNCGVAWSVSAECRTNHKPC